MLIRDLCSPRFLRVIVLAAMAASGSAAQADWTLRCSQLTLDQVPYWVRLRANGVAITQSTDAGAGKTPYLPPEIVPAGGTGNCAYRLRTANSTLSPTRVELVAFSRMNARNVRVRATINAEPSVAPRGQYVIAVRARGSDANKHGIFVRVSYGLGVMQIVRKQSTNMLLSETVLGTSSVPLNAGASNVIEVLAAKESIVARLYAADGVTLLGTTTATDNTAGFRSGDVFIGGEVSYTGTTPSSNIDLTFDDVSVVNLARTTRLGLANLPTINWTLPSNNTQGRFAFANIATNPLVPQRPRFDWIATTPTSGPTLNSFRVRAMADLNQDGGGDAIYHNLGTGLVRRVALDVRASLASAATAPRVTSTLLSVPTGWTLVTAADFTGDGDADLLWQNDSDNVIGLTTMRRTAVSGWQGMAYVPPPFKAVGSADFNLDGHFDILWQDTSNGAVYVGLMNRTNYVSFPYLGATSPGVWRVMGTFDYSFDDTPDVLWQNTSTGEVGVWILNSAGSSVARWESITTLSNTEWRGAN